MLSHLIFYIVPEERISQPSLAIARFRFGNPSVSILPPREN
jgi:hypothetical protein